ncbi:pyridoxal-phosphate dependent enzyme [Klebsiella pneumoniae]|uniref:Pyridoxal-phosphate dependent enzyme n=1 Tax=Klebsiella pneumoniae TaxID=573 RepID=A0A939SW72_KLEPN|nr:pyridoxal-phosphate dependent enzyme [Klebsiella pneumoniae]
MNAFKGLGGSYAMGKYLAALLERDINTLSFAELNSPVIKARIKDIVFVTATDGNHGRGVAWAAEQLGLRAVVYAKGLVTGTRAEYSPHGAECTITELNYDDTVRLAAKTAREQDGFYSGPPRQGYEQIPHMDHARLCDPRC